MSQLVVFKVVTFIEECGVNWQIIDRRKKWRDDGKRTGEVVNTIDTGIEGMKGTCQGIFETTLESFIAEIREKKHLEKSSNIFTKQ